MNTVKEPRPYKTSKKEKRPYQKPPRRPPVLGPLDGMDLLLSRRDLAHRWGCCLETVKRLEKAGKIRPVRLGGMLRYKAADIQIYEKGD